MHICIDIHTRARAYSTFDIDFCACRRRWHESEMRAAGGNGMESSANGREAHASAAASNSATVLSSSSSSSMPICIICQANGNGWPPPRNVEDARRHVACVRVCVCLPAITRDVLDNSEERKIVVYVTFSDLHIPIT